MHRLVFIGILALGFTCAISLTVPSHYDRATPGSISDQLLQLDQDQVSNPFS